MISNATISFTRLHSMINQPTPQIKHIVYVGIESSELQIYIQCAILEMRFERALGSFPLEMARPLRDCAATACNLETALSISR